MSHAEKSLKEIKQQNTEAQRRRRRRIKELGGTAEVNPDYSNKRRQQNAKAQRRRRLRMKEVASSLSEASTQDENIVANLSPHSCRYQDKDLVRVGKIEWGHLRVLCALLDTLPHSEKGRGVLMNQACKHIYSRMFGPARDPKEEFPYNHIIADYLRFKRQELNLHCSSTAIGVWSFLPHNILPTSIQVAYTDHPSFIDLLPWPSFRDRLVLHYQDGSLDVIEFCVDLLHHPSVTGQPCPFFINENDPLQMNSWEISQWFFEKYDYLCDQDMLESTNLQRIVRGEPLLIESTCLQIIPIGNTFSPSDAK